ncbi:MAG: cell division protein SepF [Actinobacteria bacterium]|nr:cell division protein SepF [Actinomycetota bacterium]
MSRFFKRTLSFLGLAEEDNPDIEGNDYSQKDIHLAKDDYDDYQDETREKEEPRMGSSFYKNESSRRNLGSLRTSRKLLSLENLKESKKSRVAVAEPHEFEEVQMIGDDFKENVPVIINLQNTNQDLSKRIIDFCSGLAYALGGSIKKVADRVFLITPQNTIVTSNEKEILREKGLYNQL